MAETSKASDSKAADSKATDNKGADDNRSAEDKSRAAMGRGPVTESTGGGDGESPGNAEVPPAGGDPDSVQRVVKHLPDFLRERSGLGADTPEELAAQRAEYAAEVANQRNRPSRGELAGMTDEEKAQATGQPLGDGKSTGAPSADDPEVLNRDADDARALAGEQRRAAGESKLSAPQGRQAPARSTTAKSGNNTTEGK